MDDDLGTPVQKTRSSLGKKAGVFFIVAVAVLLVYFKFGHLLSLEGLATQESQLRAYQAEHPVLVFGAAFLVYVLATGLSLPGAAALTLVYGWYFGFARGLVLVSFASTAGATMAFLLSRFLFRDAIQNRFGQRLESFNRSLEKEGPFFLFTLRLIPAVPFFVINAVMGLTPIRTRTFWWVSQVGMLAGTVIYVYAGSSVPDLQTLADKGIGAVFTPSQLVKLAIAFALLGLFPLAVRYAMKFFYRGRPVGDGQ
ncbi:TVP38/TMEM64 family inner membrane protein YdjZ [Roseimaritima multifibrata]|uniref:TVP38/TMEM64 family membrane protein n=1 Tax=Roseimaritima multifibrata TaxID=1930274 RepID=A0A517MGY1_9BACT|nr:TVP38/TMEM64 family protein [Roseimaritima multifibrata]QDS94134.1 TVP38/TMEM64 family inner membrane protein YdjZ [Roseimaritima multifibrata]